MAKIKVALRVRPRSIRETAVRYPVVVGIDENSAFITDIRVPERPSADSRQRFRQFDFDHAFWLSDEGDDGACQEEVYEEMGTSLEESILEGYNACLLAYGQSSTGKTHTMLGTKDDPGLILRLCHGLWEKFSSRCSTPDKSFQMEVSFMEIYREKVRDLLAPSEKPLKLREHPQLGPHVQGLKRIEINAGLSILDLLWEGERRRATGATGSNRHSSRSHAIWTIYLTSTRKGEDGSELITRNQVHLVDLAGSERADIATTKHLLAEGKDINRSLVSLGNVISALAERAQHIPYRDSTLTWFLKDSLGGNATTAIIITASPASSCHAQTLNSLRFAQRARLVENQPKINVTKYEGRPLKFKRNGEKSGGIFSGISTFDLKKDIARLASMIRSAQANGGILRSLTPSNGWNRLIAAIENWSHLDTSPESQYNRSNQQTQSTSMETLTNSTSLADGQVQVDFKSDASNESSDSTPRFTRKSPKKNRTGSQDVFIPLSSSFKCLTWRQQELQQIPPSANTSEDEAFVSVPSTPPSQPKVNHLKYMVPVYFPVTRNVEAEGRICEKIHGTIEPVRDSVQVVPTEVSNRYGTSPLICNKFPTLVNPQPIPTPLKMESCTPLDGLWDENLNYVKSVGVKGQESIFSFNIPNVSEFSTVARGHVAHVYQSTDEDEEFSPPPTQTSFRHGRLHKRSMTSCKGQRSMSFDLDQEQNDTGIDPGNSYTNSTISSSSYESLQVLTSPKQLVPLPIKTVTRGDFNFAEIEEKLEPFQCTCPHQMASVSCLEGFQDGGAVRRYSRLSSSSSPEVKVPLDTSSSQFRRFFVRELSDLENIGRQLKILNQKTEKYNRLKPFLIQIDQLTRIDHSVPDAQLDAEIEQCSGWNVGIEFSKVQKELSAINKILARGTGSGTGSSNGGAKLKSESSLSNTESSGSVSLDSHRSSNGSFSNNDDVFAPSRLPIPTSSKSAPLMTSTPKGQRHSNYLPSTPPTHVPSTFWSDFYKRMGPRGEGDRKLYNVQVEAEHDLEEEDPQLRRRWRPFLPKTHSYLCHQNGYAGRGGGVSSTTCQYSQYHTPRQQSYTSQYLMQRQQMARTPQKLTQYPINKQHLRSLSSEGSSSVHDGSSLSDQYCSNPHAQQHCSTDFCSCHDSLDSSGGIYWDSTYDTECPAYNSHQFQNGRQSRHEYNYRLPESYRGPKVNGHVNRGPPDYRQYAKY